MNTSAGRLQRGPSYEVTLAQAKLITSLLLMVAVWPREVSEWLVSHGPRL